MSESNIQQNNNKSNDEIDIFEFCSRLGNAFLRFLLYIKDLIVSFIIFLIRKSMWIVSFAVLGMIMGYIIYGVSRTYYISSLEANSGGIYDPVRKNYSGGVDNSVVINHINKLNLATKSPSMLANYLGINTDEAESIRSIKAYYGIDINRDMKPDYVDIHEKYNPKDTMQIRVPSFINIQVSVYDENVFPALRKGLLQYINSNAYLQELFKIDRKQKRDLIDEIEKEIKKIDSIQHIHFRMEHAKSEKGQVVFMGNEREIKLFYPDILNLYSQKQSLEKALEISDEIIMVVQDFTPLQQEERPVLLYIAFLGITMAVFGMICAQLWQHRKKIWTLIWEDSIKE